MRKTSMIISATAAAALVAGVVTIGIARTSGAVAAPVESAVPTASSAEDVARLTEALAGRSTGDANWLDRTLSETLPNVAFSWDGQPGERIFEATIDGVVIDTKPGSAHRDVVVGTDGDAVQQEDLSFDDPTAMWRIVVLTVEVRNDFDAETDLPSQIDIALWVDGSVDPDAVLQGFLGQRIFAVLEEPGRLEPSHAYPVARNAALIGVIREDGSVSFPGLDVEEEQYVDGLTTISAIEEAAAEPESVVPVSTENGYAERTD